VTKLFVCGEILDNRPYESYNDIAVLSAPQGQRGWVDDITGVIPVVDIPVVDIDAPAII
jgi:hypothetical protein